MVDLSEEDSPDLVGDITTTAFWEEIPDLSYDYIALTACPWGVFSVNTMNYPLVINKELIRVMLSKVEKGILFNNLIMSLAQSAIFLEESVPLLAQWETVREKQRLIQNEAEGVMRGRQSWLFLEMELWLEEILGELNVDVETQVLRLEPLLIVSEIIKN